MWARRLGPTAHQRPPSAPELRTRRRLCRKPHASLRLGLGYIYIYMYEQRRRRQTTARAALGASASTACCCCSPFSCGAGPNVMKNWLPLEFLPELHIATCAACHAPSCGAASTAHYSSLRELLLQPGLLVLESAPPDALKIAMCEHFNNSASMQALQQPTSPPVPFSKMKSPP